MDLQASMQRIRMFFSGGSSEPITSQQRKTALFMLILTSIYLVVELAFNARLLDVIGALEGHETIEAIEQYGRLISGTAVAILILGTILKNGAKKQWVFRHYIFSLFKIVIYCGGAMVCVFFGQRWIIDKLVDESSDVSRRSAAVLVPMNGLIKDGVIEIPSLKLTVDDYKTPEGKTFLAVFPLHTMSHPRLFQNLEGSIPAIFRAFSERIRKHSDGFYGSYTESINRLATEYEGPYQEANRKYRNAIGGDMSERQNSAWRDYELKLSQRRRNLTPRNVPRGHWDDVRNRVRGMGIPVSNSWAPSDRTGFNDAVALRVRNDALKEFRNRSQIEMGLSRPLDPQLDLQTFLRHEAIVQKWKLEMRVPSQLPLKVGMSAAAFKREIYAPTIDEDVKNLISHNYARAADYGTSGQFRKTGEDSYRALIVPPIALVFSLMGAMTHIFKIFMFLIKLTRNVSVKVYWGAFACYLFLAWMIPLQFTNKVTNQELFTRLETYTKEGFGGAKGLVVANGIRWVTQFQTYFYPVNELVRTKILPSPKFDHKITLFSATLETLKTGR